MRQGFLDRYLTLCGGSRALAWLIGLNLVISLGALAIMAILSVSGANPETIRTALGLPSEASQFATRPWTIITYMFTQFSVLHLLVNVLWLFWFGRLLLAENNERRLTVCYIISGIAGGTGYLIAKAAGASAGAYLCGSSAAVLGVMCMAGVLMADRTLRFMLIGAVKVKWIAIICVILTLIGTEGLAAVSIAHLSGVAGGIILALILKYKVSNRTVPNQADYKKSTHLKTSIREKERKSDDVAEAISGRLNDHQRLDTLLDKIRLSGYNSLSDTERRELDALTKRL